MEQSYINFSTLLKENYHLLSKSEKQVADSLLSTDYLPSNITQKELAKKSNVSEPTVVRFAKKLGFDGFTSMKNYILLDSSHSNNSKQRLIDLNIHPENRLEDVPKKIISNSIKGLEETLHLINIDAYIEIINLLLKSDTILTMGMGTSSSVAYDFFSKMIRIGLNSKYISDTDLINLEILNLSNSDVLIAFTKSGNTKNTIDAVRLAKQHSVTTVVITSFQTEKILNYADFVLFTGESENKFYNEAMVSRISMHAIIDMLYSGIIISDYNRFSKKLSQTNQLVQHMKY